MFDRRLVQNFDYRFLGLVLLIVAMGLVNLYSTGFNRGEGTPLYIRQMYWLAGGDIKYADQQTLKESLSHRVEA